MTYVFVFSEKKQSFILIATVHHDKIMTELKEKIKVVQFCNETKYGIGIMNKFLRQYKIHRPYQKNLSHDHLNYFFNIVNIAAFLIILL